jgi:hypothetical protein
MKLLRSKKTSLRKDVVILRVMTSLFVGELDPRNR